MNSLCLSITISPNRYIYIWPEKIVSFDGTTSKTILTITDKARDLDEFVGPRNSRNSAQEVPHLSRLSLNLLPRNLVFCKSLSGIPVVGDDHGQWAVFWERGTSPPYGPLYMYICAQFYRESRFFSTSSREVAASERFEAKEIK